ncbi:hypothetical protein A4G19_08475 [Pasteurellaceae bacterium Macca]|nr:hypothetical protein [Pasteurellaceae bacterium Macca]
MFIQLLDESNRPCVFKVDEISAVKDSSMYGAFVYIKGSEKAFIVQQKPNEILTMMKGEEDE